MLKALDYILGFTLVVGGTFVLLEIVWASLFLFWGFIVRIGDKKDKNTSSPLDLLLILGFFIAPVLCIYFSFMALKVLNLLPENGFQTGDARLSVIFVKTLDLIISWGASPFISALVTLLSFIAWGVGLISGTISIYEFIRKRMGRLH